MIFPTDNHRKRFVWMHVALLSLAVLCFSYSSVYAGNIPKETPRTQKGLHLLSTFEGGKLYSGGNFHVLELWERTGRWVVNTDVFCRLR